MDYSKIHILSSCGPPCYPFAAESFESQARWLTVALASIAAVYLGYLYILSRQEAPVSFNVSIPPEIRSNWTGRNWDDAQGEERRVLEGQATGVSSLFMDNGEYMDKANSCSLPSNGAKTCS